MKEAAHKTGVSVCAFIRKAAILAALAVLSACATIDNSPRGVVQTEHATIIGRTDSVRRFLGENPIDQYMELIARTDKSPVVIPISFYITDRDTIIKRCRAGVRVTACNLGGGVVYIEADAPKATVLEEIAHAYHLDEFAAWQLRCKADFRQAGCTRFERF